MINSLADRIFYLTPNGIEIFEGNYDDFLDKFKPFEKPVQPEKEHIEKQRDMLSDAVTPEDIDIIGGKIPDLDNSQRTERIGVKGCRLNKSVRKAVQQQIIPAYNINENQVIDQLNIFDFFLFLSRQILRHTSPH